MIRKIDCPLFFVHLIVLANAKTWNLVASN